MSIPIKGGTSGVMADVDSATKALLALIKGGLVNVAATNGDAINCSDTGALRVSAGELIFYDQVEGANLNTNLWAPSTDTLAIAIVNEAIQLNSGNATTASKYALVQSIKQFPMYSLMPLVINFNALTNVIPQSGLTMELGIGLASGVSVPTDGCYFRWNPQGQFVCIINNAGTETSSGALTGVITDEVGDSATLPPAVNVMHLYQIEVVENAVEFFVDDVLIATVNVPAGQAFPTNNGHLPLLARYYNSATPPSQAGQLSVGQAVVTQDDVNQNKPWSETLAGIGRGCYQNQLSTFGHTANHANSTNPTSATLSNTAAGYTTMGGRFQFAAAAGAVTDFSLFAFQVPVPYQLYVTAITISLLNTGAIGSAITPSLFDWAVGVNASAVSLATVDGSGTWAPRRIPLGTQAYGLSAVIGAAAPDISRIFSPPLVVDAGRFLHVIVQLPVGAATASQIFRGDILITGYFE